MSKLKASNVLKVLKECMFKEEEINEDRSTTMKPVRADGITNVFGFHPERLKNNEQTIIEFLNKLPDDFRKSIGGGSSFLNACEDKNGHQWTDFHRDVEALICLGIAIKRIAYCAPRDLWPALPGGMPYIVYYDKEVDKNERSYRSNEKNEYKRNG